jgi:hypothetical protein
MYFTMDREESPLQLAVEIMEIGGKRISSPSFVRYIFAANQVSASIFWDIAACSLYVKRRFGGISPSS